MLNVEEIRNEQRVKSEELKEGSMRSRMHRRRSDDTALTLPWSTNKRTVLKLSGVPISDRISDYLQEIKHNAITFPIGWEIPVSRHSPFSSDANRGITHDS